MSVYRTIGPLVKLCFTMKASEIIVLMIVYVYELYVFARCTFEYCGYSLQ